MTGPSPTPSPPSAGKWWIATGIGLGVLMATVDASIVNVSLPTVAQSLHADFAAVQWVILSYILMLTSLLLSMGRLGDLFGKRRIYLLGLAVFTTGSFLCGAAPTVGWLTGFRAFQGVGAAMMQGLGAAILTESFPPSERGKALGIMGAVVSVGLAMGPPLGGMIIGLAGWRWIFYVNVPLGFLAWMVTMRNVPESAPHEGSKRFDAAGALLLLMFLCSYAVAMTMGQRWGYANGKTLLFLAAGVIFLASFVMVEKRIQAPMVDLNLFRNALFSLNLLMGLFVFIVLGGTVILPFYLELVRHYPTEKVGLFMVVVPLTMGTIAPVSGTLSDHWGSRGISIAGLLVVVVGCLALNGLTTQTTGWEYILRIIPLGVGLGLFLSPNNSAIMGAAPTKHLGVASGLLSLSRTLGHASGVPLMGAVFSAQTLAVAGLPAGSDTIRAPVSAMARGVAHTFGFGAALVLLPTLLAVAAWIIDRRNGVRD